jgi:hypothetical protein
VRPDGFAAAHLGAVPQVVRQGVEPALGVLGRGSPRRVCVEALAREREEGRRAAAQPQGLVRQRQGSGGGEGGGARGGGEGIQVDGRRQRVGRGQLGCSAKLVHVNFEK